MGREPFHEPSHERMKGETVNLSYSVYTQGNPYLNI